MSKASRGNYFKPIFVIIIIAIAGMLYFIFQKQNSRQSFQQLHASISAILSISSIPAPSKVSIEYPPLYPEIQWEAPTKIQMDVVKQSPSGIIDTSVEADQIQSFLLAQSPLDNKKFWDYYNNALKVKSWDEYQLNDSSGPQGATQFWINKGHYFGIGWKEEYNGAPQTDMYGKPLNIKGYRIFIKYN